MLIGSTIAIGLKHGKGINKIPLEDKSTRDKANAESSALYQDFIEQFGSTDCSTLIDCDFSQPGEHDRYLNDQLYMNTCLRFFNHVMNQFFEEDKKANN